MKTVAEDSEKHVKATLYSPDGTLKKRHWNDWKRRVGAPSQDYASVLPWKITAIHINSIAFSDNLDSI